MQPGSPRSCKSTINTNPANSWGQWYSAYPGLSVQNILHPTAGRELGTARAAKLGRPIRIEQEIPMSQPLATTNKADPLKVHPEDFPDIQGFILHGYNMPKSRHFVLTIGQVEAALDFLSALTSGSGALSITSAERWPRGVKPEYALNIGLTARGLEALKLPAASLKINQGNFSSFLAGAVAAAKTVGDVGPNDPANWVPKLNTANADRAHLLLSLYTNTAEDRETLRHATPRNVCPGHPTGGCAWTATSWSGMSIPTSSRTRSPERDIAKFTSVIPTEFPTRSSTR